MTHEEVREQSAAYALGALDSRERTDVERHMDGCVACRAEIDAQCEVAALLALAAPPIDPQRVISAWRISGALTASPSCGPLQASGQCHLLWIPAATLHRWRGGP